MRILIIGGAGFIGSRTALRLAAAGHAVVVVDNFDPQTHGYNLAAAPGFAELLRRVTVMAADALTLDRMESVWEGVEAVLYLASSTGTGQSMYDVRGYTLNNVQVAAVVAEQLHKRRAQIRRVVVSGTRAVYGEGSGRCANHGNVFPQRRLSEAMALGQFGTVCPKCGVILVPLPSLESDPAGPTSIYGITKLAQENIIRNVCETDEIPAIFFRYQNVYGPGQSLKNPYTGILSIFSQLLLQDRPINIFEDGLATRDFVFVDDVTEFNCRAVESSLSGSHTLNVGTGSPQSLLDVVGALGAAFRRTPAYSVSGQFRIGDIRHAAADTTMLLQTFGGHAFVGFQEGINQFAAWVLQQDLEAGADSRYIKSLAEMEGLGLLRGRKTSKKPVKAAV